MSEREVFEAEIAALRKQIDECDDAIEWVILIGVLSIPVFLIVIVVASMVMNR